MNDLNLTNAEKPSVLTRRKGDTKQKAKATALAGGGALMAARGGQYFLPASPSVRITYEYRKGKGGGHKSLAEEYAGLVKKRGITSELQNLHGSTKLENLKLQAKEWLKSPQYLGRIHTGASVNNFPIKGNAIPHGSWDLSPDGAALPIKPRTAKVSYVPGKLGPEFKRQGKKIITVGAGESGYRLDEKVQHLQEVLKKRKTKDAHIIVLGGTNAESLQKLKSKNTTILGTLPKQTYQRYIASSDLNIGYAGSSAVIEGLAAKNPQMNVHTVGTMPGEAYKPFKQNPQVKKNFQYAERYGIPRTSTNAPDFELKVNEFLNNGDAAASGRSNAYIKDVGKAKAKFYKSLASQISRNKIVKPLTGGALLLGGGALVYSGINHFKTK